jgi:hypothetical protein
MHIIFANQLLQIPGVTEKVAMSIAERFHTPIGLIEYLSAGRSLDGLQFQNNKQEAKKYDMLLNIMTHSF